MMRLLNWKSGLVLGLVGAGLLLFPLPTRVKLDCPSGTRLEGNSPAWYVPALAEITADGPRDFAQCLVHAASQSAHETLACQMDLGQRGFKAYCVAANGKWHGPWVGWSEYGERLMSGEYRDGKMHGEVTEWFSGGLKRQTMHFFDGFRCGRLTEWDDSAQLVISEYRGRPCR